MTLSRSIHFGISNFTLSAICATSLSPRPDRFTMMSASLANRPESDTAAEAVQWAEEHLFEQRSVVPEHEIWRQALLWARGQTVSVNALKLATGKRNYVRDESQVASVTTREVLGREWEIVRAGSEGVSAFVPFVRALPVMPENFAKEQGAALKQGDRFSTKLYGNVDYWLERLLKLIGDYPKPSWERLRESGETWMRKRERVLVPDQPPGASIN